jgi:phosphopantetheinyl transferase (holo-ACP synthase)
MPSSTRDIPYAIAVATPRDTREITPAMPTSEGDPETEWSEPRRRDWLASRLAAKRAASGLASQLRTRGAREEVFIETTPTTHGTSTVRARRIGGRTATRVLSFPLDLSISISHSEGHALAAAAPHPARVGVDLEREGQVDPAHAHYFLSPLELRQHESRSLTELWALKESAWKALGCEETTPFRDLELIADIAGGMTAARLGNMVVPMTAEVSRPWPGWIAAVVVIKGLGE